MHRTTGRPDWDSVALSARNRFQRVAATTGGIVTPGNVVTLVGFGMVIVGLAYIAHSQYRYGVLLLVVGRLLDIVDGWLAQSTGTKSPLGESLDAGFDKLGTVLTVIALYFSHIAAWWILLVLVLPHLFISGFAAAVLQQGKQLHPSRVGKLSMAAAWVSLPGLVVLKALNADQHSFVAMLVYATIGLSFGMGTYAAAGYARQKAPKS